MKSKLIITRYILTILFAIFTNCIYGQTSFYNNLVKTLDGQQIGLSKLSNKTIMIVNTASLSSKCNQLAELKSLANSFKSIVIIIVPSDEFGNEPKNNQELIQYFGTLPINIIITEKSALKGPGRSSIFQYLSNKTENGRIEIEATGDYQKFIIKPGGKISSVFSGKISPMSSPIIEAISVK